MLRGYEKTFLGFCGVVVANSIISAIAILAGGSCYWLEDLLQPNSFFANQFRLLSELFYALAYCVGFAQVLYLLPVFVILARRRKQGYFVGVILGGLLSLVASLRFVEWLQRLS